MTSRQRSHPGFYALVACVVRELEGHGLTLTPELVHDELRLLLRRPESEGGLPERERLDLLGPQACERLAERIREQLRLPDLTGPRDALPRPTVEPDAVEPEDGRPCPVVDLDEHRRGR